jgi:hypothetical protein
MYISLVGHLPLFAEEEEREGGEGKSRRTANDGEDGKDSNDDVAASGDSGTSKERSALQMPSLSPSFTLGGQVLSGCVLDDDLTYFMKTFQRTAAFALFSTDVAHTAAVRLPMGSTDAAFRRPFDASLHDALVAKVRDLLRRTACQFSAHLNVSIIPGEGGVGGTGGTSRGARKTMAIKRRWVVLDGSALTYYKTSSKRKVKGKVDMSDRNVTLTVLPAEGARESMDEGVHGGGGSGCATSLADAGCMVDGTSFGSIRPVLLTCKAEGFVLKLAALDDSTQLEMEGVCRARLMSERLSQQLRRFWRRHVRSTASPAGAEAASAARLRLGKG